MKHDIRNVHSLELFWRHSRNVLAKHKYSLLTSVLNSFLNIINKILFIFILTYFFFFPQHNLYFLI